MGGACCASDKNTRTKRVGDMKVKKNGPVGQMNIVTNGPKKTS